MTMTQFIASVIAIYTAAAASGEVLILQSMDAGSRILVEYLERHPKAISSGGLALGVNVVQQIEHSRDNMVHYTQLLKRLGTTYQDHL